MPKLPMISSHRRLGALATIIVTLSLAACSSSDDVQEVFDSTTTSGAVTTAPEPLDADQDVAVREAVIAYHAAVAASFEPIDPESPALRATTTPAYFESLSGLLQSLLDSGRTATSDYVAEIIEVRALAEGVARVDLCEIDRTVIYEADGTSASAAPSTEPRASFVALVRNEAGAWRIDGGGLDDSGRACP